jgi:DNA (cytosine-5)-methyltransferase 1
LRPDQKLGTLQKYSWEKPPKFISLFSGCGGLDLPFHLAGFELVWANDHDKFSCQTFSKNISSNIYCGSIEEVDITSIPDADLIIGGFPCQDFSVIWKQPGLNGNRGNLYKYFLNFVKEKKPKAFIAENVKGLLSANDHKAIKQIISDFEEAFPGYIVKPKIYNFAEYGVPQFRQRVILVGIRLDTGFNFIHPSPDYGPGRKFPFVSSRTALADVDKVKANSEYMNISPTTIERLKLIPPGGNFTSIPKDNPLYVKGLISHVYRRLDPDQPSSTIIAGGGGGTWGYHYDEPRALTNRERARLQSFPDEFSFEGSFTEVRRQIGNAVPPFGVVKIVESLIPLFTGNYDKVDLYEIDEKLKNLPITERLRISQTEAVETPYKPEKLFE